MSQEPPTEHRPAYLVKRVQQLVRQSCDEQLRAIGVSMSQYAVLRALDEHPGASSSELARLCFVTRQSLRDVLSGLRGAGLVEVAERATTGRALPTRITALGEQRLAEAAQVVDAVEARMLDGIGSADRERLAELLLRCSGNLGG